MKAARTSGRVRRPCLRWVGTATNNYGAMTRFVRVVLGLNVSFQDAATTEFTILEGDALQVMGPVTLTSTSSAGTRAAPCRCSRSRTSTRRRRNSVRRALSSSAHQVWTGSGTGSTSAHRMVTSTGWRAHANPADTHAREVQPIMRLVAKQTAFQESSTAARPASAWICRCASGPAEYRAVGVRPGRRTPKGRSDAGTTQIEGASNQ